MSSDRWRQIEDLFDAARKLNPHLRADYLKQACGEDESLRREVESLLSAHREAKDFIQNPIIPDAVRLLADSDEALAPGAQAGAYRIQKEIARGGMGTVYLAQRADEQYKQLVAIKVIKRGMDTDTVLRHFRDERQILAGFDHPNIGRLFDGGMMESGLPYFVMEYVEGQRIDQYCDAKQLNITQRLELFRQVLSAVSYAHRHLVIHRDIKPSNILVTTEGSPKLLDFGIAKILPQEGAIGVEATATVAPLMTPEYASPEQAQGLAVTTQTDVYSLGVLLYELLTGHPPYHLKNRTATDVIRSIIETEPPLPSLVIETAGGNSVHISRLREGTPERLRRRLRGDLDNIVMMAIRKEPQRRYQSAEQFSEDLRRHLQGLPVIARRDTLGYRAGKFVRRNRSAVAAAILIAFILIAGVVATTWEAYRARTQEALAREEQQLAERRFNDVRKLAHAVLFDYHDAIKDLPGSTPVRERLVRDALVYLDSLASEKNNDVSLQRELASAYEKVGDVQGGSMFANLGNTTGAILSYRKALKIREALMAAQPSDIPILVEAATNYKKLGVLLWETGDIDGALKNNLKSVSIFQALIARQPQNREIVFDLGAGYDYVGMILQERGDAPGALQNFTKELESYSSISEREQKQAKSRRAISTAYEHLGLTFLQMNDFTQALENNRKALAMREAMVADYPLNADYRRMLAVSYYNDGEILSNMRRFPEALESYQKDVKISQELSSADPKNEQYRGDSAYASIRVGDMLVHLDQEEQALPFYKKARSIWTDDTRADPANLWKRSSLIESHAKISKALAKSGRDKDAWAECNQTYELMKNTTVDPANAAIRGFFADTYADLGDAYSMIASHGTMQNAWAPAREMFAKSLEIWDDLKNRKIMSPSDIQKPESVKQKIADCEKAISRLRT